MLIEQLESRVLLSSLFGPPTPAPGQSSLTQIESVVTGDFDGDGIADIAASTGDTIAFLKGIGDGTFAHPVVTALASQVGLLATGRFDGSGRLQIASVGNVGKEPVFISNAAPLGRGYALRVFSFDPYTGGLSIQARRLVIVDHEDYFGIQGVDLPPQSVRLLAGDILGSSADEFIVGLDIHTDDYALTPGIAHHPQHSIIASFGLDTSGAIAQVHMVLDREGAGNDIVLADINGDGRQDLLFRPAHTWRAEISPAAHTGPLSLTAQRLTIPGSNESTLGGQIKFADVNGDGIADRIVFRPSAPLQSLFFYDLTLQMSIARGNADGTFGTAIELPRFSLFSVGTGGADEIVEEARFLLDQVQVQDINADGRPDILLEGRERLVGRGGDFSYVEQAVMLQNPDGTFARESLPEDSGSSSVLADLNGDSRPDMIVVRTPFFDDTAHYIRFGIYARLGLAT